MFIQKRKITAGEEVEVAPEATDLLFEAEDVAELVAEVTDETVTAETTEEGDVEFTVGEDDVYTVQPEGDEEVLEATHKSIKNKKPVKASTNRKNRKRNVVRKFPSKR